MNLERNQNVIGSLKNGDNQTHPDLSCIHMHTKTQVH